MQNFQNLVLEKSIDKPVLVDFWADWCQPCQTIMPMLAKLAEEYAGKFELAKVNADQEQELAAHFGIKSLPTMKLFFQGKLVDERLGAVAESEIRAMLDKHIVSEAQQYMQAAMLAYDQGQPEQALEMLNLALTKDPDNASIKVTIAELVHAQGDTASAITLLDSLDSEGSKLDAAIKLRAAIKLAEQLAELPALEEIEQRLLKNPLDLEALLFKSRHLTALGDYDDAMACLLTIVRTDRGFEDDIGRVSLLALFDLLGGDHPSVQTSRRKLFTLLH
jgi:putative thioredoxin